MPLNNPSPNFALLSAFNARTWSNVNVFDRGSNNVTLPTFATGEGIFDDAISFLNGRGSESGFAMSDLLQATAPFGTSWSVTINSSDKVVISCNDQFKIRFKSGVDVLGHHHLVQQPHHSLVQMTGHVAVTYKQPPMLLLIRLILTCSVLQSKAD